MKKKQQIVIQILLVAMLLQGCNAKFDDTKPTIMESIGTADTTQSSISATIPNGNSFKDPFAKLPESFDDYTFPTDPEANVILQYLPEAVENPEKLPVLKWVILTEEMYGGLSQNRSTEAVVELNQMLADRNLPFRVQFILLMLDQRVNGANWLSRPETQEALAEADLIWSTFNADELQEYLFPITEYVTGEAEPSLENAVPHELSWLTTTVNGEIYGIALYPVPTYSNGWCVDATLLTDFCLTEQDFERNFWEMDEIFAKIYKENGNKPFLGVSGSLWSTSTHGTGALTTMLPSAIYDTIRHTYQFIGAGFAIDHNAERPKVVNVLKEETVRSIWSSIMRYQNAGYIIRNTEKEAEKHIRVKYTGVVGNSVYTNEDGWICVPIMQSSFKGIVSGGGKSGIAAASQNKTEAIQFLNLIAEDEEIRMQMLFGKEGRDYEVVDGAYSLTTRDDGSRYSLSILSPLSYFSGLITKSGNSSSDFSPGPFSTDIIALDGKSRLETYRGAMDNVGFCHFPIIFDYSVFGEELAAIKEIFVKYYPEYINSTVMTEDRYEQMLLELKNAGSEKIIAELQRQLDEWLANNPDWQ